MANRIRGEVEIVLAGQSYLMRPSFGGLAEIEDKSGLDLLALAIKLGNNKTAIKDLVAVIYGGMKGAGSALSYEEVGELVVDEGVTKVAKPVAQFLSMALSGAKESDKKSGDAVNPPTV